MRQQVDVQSIETKLNTRQQRNPIDVGVTTSKVNVTRVKCEKTRVRLITQECLDLPSSNLVHTSIPGSRGTLWIVDSLGLRSRSPGSNLPKHTFSSYMFVQLLLNWLIQLYKHLWQKHFRGYNVLQISLIIVFFSFRGLLHGCWPITAKWKPSCHQMC